MRIVDRTVDMSVLAAQDRHDRRLPSREDGRCRLGKMYRQLWSAYLASVGAVSVSKYLDGIWILSNKPVCQQQPRIWCESA